MHDAFVAVSTHAKHLVPEQAACMVMMPPLLSKVTVIKNFKWTLLFMATTNRWRFSVAVTRWSRSTHLLYIEPG